MVEAKDPSPFENPIKRPCGHTELVENCVICAQWEIAEEEGTTPELWNAFSDGFAFALSEVADWTKLISGESFTRDGMLDFLRGLGWDDEYEDDDELEFEEAPTPPTPSTPFQNSYGPSILPEDGKRRWVLRGTSDRKLT